MALSTVLGILAPCLPAHLCRQLAKAAHLLCTYPKSGEEEGQFPGASVLPEVSS